MNTRRALPAAIDRRGEVGNYRGRMAGEDAARRALVTGATGFVGTALVRRLAADGWSVDALVRTPDAALPDAVASGKEAFWVVGAIAGG